MKNTVILTVIIFIGLVSLISPQQKFRKMAYLNQSVGGHIYNHAGASTNVQAEVTAYNIARGYTGNDAVTITKVSSDDDYPPGGNQLWKWWDAFRDAPGYSFKEDILETSTYSVIMIKHCFASQSDIWFYWYEGPGDTLNYPTTQSIYNYQWYTRKIARKMEQYPEKFFVWWDIPPMVAGENGNVADMQRLRWFNKWMVDTLQAGLDTLYGDFPDNIYVYDYFELVDSANFLPLSLADSWTDSHPNAACSELVAPDFVHKAFDAAIAYEVLPVELISFTASIDPTGVNLNWSTASELNNDKFEIQKKTDSGEFIAIGFVKGQGTSTQKNNYSFLDKDTDSGKYYYRLKQIDFDGNYEYSKVVAVEFNPIITYSLEQNYPNPFNPSTEINFTLANSGNITLKVYDSLGIEVATLVAEFMKSGKHSVKFNAKNFRSGVYYYKITADNFTSTRKMLLIK